MKQFVDMTNRELFSVLTGNDGPMAQMQLQKVVRAYLAYSRKQGPDHPDADLHTMVMEYLDGKYEQ